MRCIFMIELISKFIDYAKDGISNLKLTLFILISFFIHISPSLIFLLLYRDDLLKYNTVIVCFLIISITSFIFIFFYSTTSYLASYLIARELRNSYKKLNEKDLYNYYLKYRICICDFLVSILALSLLIYYYHDMLLSLPTSFILFILIIIIIYFLLFYFIPKDSLLSMKNLSNDNSTSINLESLNVEIDNLKNKVSILEKNEKILKDYLKLLEFYKNND